MYTVTSNKRLASLVLAILMVASLLSVSAAANTQIFIDGELAVSGTEYDKAVTVTVEGDDVNAVTVNDVKVEFGDDGSFELTPVEALTPAEPVETAEEPENTADQPKASADEAATSDSANAPIESGAALNTVEALYGDVVIAVYNSTNELTSSVAVKFVEKKSVPEDTTDPTDPVDPTDPTDPVDPTDPTDVTTSDDATSDIGTPEVATIDVATHDNATTDVATRDNATPDDATPDDPGKTDPEPPAPVVYAPGDMDNDGVITSGDALMVLRASVGLVKLSAPQEAAADVVKDGTINSSDALKILRVSVDLDSFNK